VIEDGFPAVWVSGEVSNYRRHTSGHIYLTLKDADAKLPAVIWRSSAIRIRFQPKEGMEVICHGRLSLYPPQGQYQLIVDELQPKGIGALELALRELKEKLSRLGYFAAERKRPIPRIPDRVALVTSPTGAAVRDILEVLGRRWRPVEIWVCPVRVQGDGASEEIAAAVRRLNRVPGIDVMIVGRGGGSSEDLWAFNAECVAQAFFESRIPIISAVGHEIDLTIADLVADCRALTPSEAAERAVPHCQEFLDGLKGVENRLGTHVLRRLESARSRMDGLSERRCFRLPLERVQELGRRLDDLSERMQRSAKQQLTQTKRRLEAHALHLQSLSPLNVLGRGYSLTRKEMDGTLVRTPAQVRPGERLITSVEHGQIISRVEESKESPLLVKDDGTPKLA
jgi:exodeoxyribonuclease VII large subunit